MILNWTRTRLQFFLEDFENEGLINPKNQLKKMHRIFYLKKPLKTGNKSSFQNLEPRERSSKCQQLPFYFYVYFEGSPPIEEPKGLCLGRSAFLCVPMFPQKYFFLQNKKEKRKSKESYLHQGRFLNSCVLLRFGNTLRCPSLKRTHLHKNLPYIITKSLGAPPTH